MNQFLVRPSLLELPENIPETTPIPELTKLLQSLKRHEH